MSATALVTQLSGQAWIRNPDGNLQPLRVGMHIPVDAEIITAAGSSMSLQAEGGSLIRLAENQQLTLSEELFQLPDANEASVVEPANEEVNAIIAALNSGQDPLQDLEATEAVLGGGEGAGSSYVRLANVIELTNPLGLEYPRPMSPLIEQPQFSGAAVDNSDSTDTPPQPPVEPPVQPPQPPVEPPVQPPQPPVEPPVQPPQPPVEPPVQPPQPPVEPPVEPPQPPVEPPVQPPVQPPPVVTPDNNSVQEATGDTVQGTVTVSAQAGVAAVLVNGQDVSGASDTPVRITTANGTLVIDGYNAATGVISYSYTEDGITNDHSAGDVLDSFVVSVTDVTGKSATGDLTIQILDTAPVADHDAHAIDEDAIAPITGQVLVNDVLGADALQSVSFADTTAQFGQFTVDAQGVWSYTLDSSLAQVQALDAGDVLQERFTYTLTDADGSQSTATLVITINGANDGPPTVILQDADGDVTPHHNSVLEATGDTVQGTVTVSAQAGVAAVLVNGQDVSGASNTPVRITTANGTLVIDGYNAATGVISYSYTEDGITNDHSAGDVLDSFVVSVTDVTGKSATGDLTIQILDTAPVADHDVHAIDEDAIAPITGQVLVNDVLGADALQSVSFADTTAQFGQFTVDAQGVWSYTLDSSLAQVQALDAGDVLQERFTYTLTDADGSQSTATLVININGANDGPPTITPTDSDSDISKSHNNVTEATGDVVSGTVKITADAGIASLTAGGKDITDASTNPVEITTAKGIVTITGFDKETGVVTYTYKEAGHASNHSAGDESVTDSVTFELVDGAGKQTSNDLTIQINDTQPVLNAQNHTSYIEQVGANLILTLDTSGSMHDLSGVYKNGVEITRLQVLKDAVNNMLDKYQEIGDTKVLMIEFDERARPLGSGWMSVDQAKQLVNGLEDDVFGQTNYREALNQAMSAWQQHADERLSGAGIKNVSYFFTDGEPYITVSPLTPYVLSGQQAQWEKFLADNEINSYGIGLGKNVSAGNINPISFDPEHPTAPASNNTIVVTDVNALDAEIQKTIPQPITDNVVSSGNLGADVDNAKITYVKVGGKTYIYDGESKSVSSPDGGTFSFDASKGILTIEGMHGTFVLTLEGALLGSYRYIPESIGTDVVEYGLVDGDGDAVNSTINFTVADASERGLSPLMASSFVALDATADNDAAVNHAALLTAAMLASDVEADDTDTDVVPNPDVDADSVPAASADADSEDAPDATAAKVDDDVAGDDSMAADDALSIASVTADDVSGAQPTADVDVTAPDSAVVDDDVAALDLSDILQADTSNADADLTALLVAENDSAMPTDQAQFASSNGSASDQGLVLGAAPEGVPNPFDAGDASSIAHDVMEQGKLRSDM